MSQSEIAQVLERVEALLMETWSETGFGHIEVDSERCNGHKIRVLVRGSTHYRYIITDEEVQRRASG